MGRYKEVTRSCNMFRLNFENVLSGNTYPECHEFIYCTAKIAVNKYSVRNVIFIAYHYI